MLWAYRVASTTQLEKEAVSMCLLYTYKPSLTGQYGCRPAIYQNQHRDRLASASIWSLPFWQLFLLTLFLGFLTSSLPVDGVLVVFTSLLSHIKMASLCLFVLSKRQSHSLDLHFQFFRFRTAAVAHQNFPPVSSINHILQTEKKEERQSLSLAGSPRITIL